MAGLGDSAPIITPRASDIVTPPNLVVSPQSTTALTDAFRSGFVTADDIIERVGARAKEKKKLESLQTQQQIADLENPEMQEVRLITARVAKSRGLRQIRDDSEAEQLAPLRQQAERAKTQRAVLDDVTMGVSEKIATVLPMNGFSIPKTSDGQVDVEQGSALLNDILQFDALKKRAEATFSAVKEVPLTTATGAVYRTYENLMDENMSSDDARKLRENAKQILGSNIQDWAMRNKPRGVSAWGDPGQVAAPAAAVTTPVAQPAVTPEQRAALANQLGPAGPQQVSQMTNAQVIAQPAVAPAAPAAPAAVTAPQLGQMVPGIGRLVTEGKPLVEKHTQENTMQQQLSQRKEIVGAAAARSALAPAQGILANVNPDGSYTPAIKDKRANDYTLIVTMAKILDPDSVAREGEVLLASRAPSFIQNYLSDIPEAAKIIFGDQSFSPAVRQGFKERLLSAASQRNELARQVVADFANQATQIGVDPGLAVGADRLRDLQSSGWKPGTTYSPSLGLQSPATAAPAAGGPVFTMPGGQRVQKLPDGRFQVVQ